MRPDARINDKIKATEVRLIDQDGEQVGVVAFDEALRRAKAADLDLVEVGPDPKTPTCRIYDFRKVLYEQKRKMKEGRKKTKASELKECKMRVTIDPHDRATKIKKVREFLEKGDKVKFTFQYRGREVTKPQLGQALVAAVMADLKDIAEMEKPPQQQNRFLHMIVTRRKDWKPKAAAKPGTPAAAKGEQVRDPQPEPENTATP